MSILKPLALQKTLEQANTGGVYAALLLSQSGSPIAQAVLESEKMTASIAGHIWKVRDLGCVLRFKCSAMTRFLTPLFQLILNTGDSIRGGEIEHLIIECEKGKVSRIYIF